MLEKFSATIITLAYFEVGKDVFGASNVENLRNLGVDTRYIDVSESGKTGCATVIVAKDGKHEYYCSSSSNTISLSLSLSTYCAL